MTVAMELWHVCGWYQDDDFPRCMLGTRFRGSPISKYGIMYAKLAGPLPLFSSWIGTAQVMSIKSMGISVTDTYPDRYGCRNSVLLRTAWRMAVSRMAPSASQTVCGRIAIVQGLWPDPPMKFVEHILFWLFENWLFTRRIASIHKLRHFKWRFKFRKGPSVTPKIHG